jgi:hypothetical protein
MIVQAFRVAEHPGTPLHRAASRAEDSSLPSHLTAMAVSAADVRAQSPTRPLRLVSPPSATLVGHLTENLSDASRAATSGFLRSSSLIPNIVLLAYPHQLRSAANLPRN